jgi:riboflavin biosynthesis pyrimidine reductase
VLYLAPALMGGDGGSRLFAGAGAATMADLWRGRVVDVRRVGDDLRVDLAPVAAEPVTITGPTAVTQGAS